MSDRRKMTARSPDTDSQDSARSIAMRGNTAATAAESMAPMVLRRTLSLHKDRALLRRSLPRRGSVLLPAPNYFGMRLTV